MPGKIKSGQGALIGNAGEYYVMAELLKRGVIAGLAPRNAAAFDILATKDDKSIRIRVKTKSEDYDVWQWSSINQKPIFKDLHESCDFTVLVNLALHLSDIEYYVIPSHLLNQWLIADFDAWLARPGLHGKDHNKNNPKRNLSKKKYSIQLAPYQDCWDSLWK